MAMVASIYMTVAIALERYIAVSRPISTYVGGGDNEETMAAWLKVLKYVGPVILLSVAINISTFFEFFIKWETVTLPGKEYFDLIYRVTIQVDSSPLIDIKTKVPF